MKLSEETIPLKCGNGHTLGIVQNGRLIIRPPSGDVLEIVISGAEEIVCACGARRKWHWSETATERLMERKIERRNIIEAETRMAK